MKRQAGFTITELVLSIAVAGVLTLVLFTATFYYYVGAVQAQTASDLTLESQTILTQLTDDIRLSDAISSTNAITDPNAPPGGWITSDPSNIIIIENPAVDSGHNIIYDDATGSPYRNEFIYFQSGKNMYKRVLANPNAAGNVAKTTCPQDQSSSTCPSDRLFSANVSNLSFTFYDSSGSTTADATKTRSVSFTINMAKKIFGKNILIANTTRVTLRNV
jgi:type II secretory pathway pseudopilin PulG